MITIARIAELYDNEHRDEQREFYADMIMTALSANKPATLKERVHRHLDKVIVNNPRASLKIEAVKYVRENSEHTTLRGALDWIKANFPEFT